MRAMRRRAARDAMPVRQLARVAAMRKASSAYALCRRQLGQFAGTVMSMVRQLIAASFLVDSWLCRYVRARRMDVRRDDDDDEMPTMMTTTMIGLRADGFAMRSGWSRPGRNARETMMQLRQFARNARMRYVGR